MDMQGLEPLKMPEVNVANPSRQTKQDGKETGRETDFQKVMHQKSKETEPQKMMKQQENLQYNEPQISEEEQSLLLEQQGCFAAMLCPSGSTEQPQLISNVTGTDAHTSSSFELIAQTSKMAEPQKEIESVKQRSIPSQSAIETQEGKPAEQPVILTEPKIVESKMVESKVFQAGTVTKKDMPQAEESVFQQSFGEEKDVTIFAESQPLFRDVEAPPVKVGDIPVVETQTPEMDENLAKQIDFAQIRGETKVKIQLSPESLGTVTIEMTHGPKGELHVILHAAEEHAVHLLEKHAGSLQSLLTNSQENPVQLEVQREQDSAFSSFDREGQGRQSQQQQQQRHPQQSHDFLQRLRLGLTAEEIEAS